MLTGAVLAGAELYALQLAILIMAISLFYVGGMYLNDAFDREIDSRERPERPIPSGQVSARTVFGLGFGMLAAGVVLLMAMGFGTSRGTGWPPVVSGIALAGTIIFYDAYHKQNPFSPLVMGLCRVLVYATAALAFRVGVPAELSYGSIVLLSYLIGLTYVAKQENLQEFKNLWPLALLGAPLVYGVKALSDPTVILLYIALGFWAAYALSFLLRKDRLNIPYAVASLIAGISLVDALLIAMQGQGAASVFAVLGFGATLAFHRLIPGT